MRVPEFTAEASLGKSNERYALTSEYMAGASPRSLQPQLQLHPLSACTLAGIDCFLFKNCDTYYKYCVPTSPLGGGGGGSNGSTPPGPGSTTVFSGVS